MPNHVINRLVFDAPPEKIQEVFDFLKGEDEVIDFNKLIPKPPIFEDVCIGGRTFGSVQMSNWIEKRVICTEIPDFVEIQPEVYLSEHDGFKWYFHHQIIQGEVTLCRAFPGNQEEINLCNKYGAKNWYDWSCKYWGTKWNAYESTSDSDTLEFHTAWSAPYQIIEAIAEKFPDVNFEYYYADEDIGHNCGSGFATDGSVDFHLWDSGSNDAVSFAKDLWGYDSSLEESEDEAIG